MQDIRWIVIDTETTSATTSAGVCEFAFAEIDENFNILIEHTSLIDPEKPITASASGIHGIVDEDVVDSPTLAEYMYMVHETPPLEGQVVIIGHNVQFDMRYIGPYVPNQVGQICTLRLARRFLPDAENHKLQTLMHALKLQRRGSHRADSDVFTTIGLLQHLAGVSGKNLPQLLAAMSEAIKVEKMPFGKHKGKLLTDIPPNDRKWLLGLDNLDPDLRRSLEAIR